MAPKSNLICIFCGRDISRDKQLPVPVDRIEFRPYIGDEQPAIDVITFSHSCQACYAGILANRAKAIKELGKIRTVEED